MSARCSREYTNIWKFLIFCILVLTKQFGFRKKHSTIDALAELAERISSGKSETVSFFLI